MTIDYITRPEFEEHKSHLDTRFDGIESKIDHESKLMRKEIETSTYDLKDTINKEKLTTKRFWIGISIPGFLGAASLVVSIISIFVK